MNRDLYNVMSIKRFDQMTKEITSQVNSAYEVAKQSGCVEPYVSGDRCPVCGELIYEEDVKYNPADEERCVRCEYTRNRFLDWEDMTDMTKEECHCLRTLINVIEDIFLQRKITKEEFNSSDIFTIDKYTDLQVTRENILKVLTEETLEKASIGLEKYMKYNNL